MKTKEIIKSIEKLELNKNDIILIKTNSVSQLDIADMKDRMLNETQKKGISNLIMFINDDKLEVESMELVNAAIEIRRMWVNTLMNDYLSEVSYVDRLKYNKVIKKWANKLFEERKGLYTASNIIIRSLIRYMEIEKR
jgi:hypothetical protein